MSEVHEQIIREVARCRPGPALALIGLFQLGCSSLSYEMGPASSTPVRQTNLAQGERSEYHLAQENDGDVLRLRLEPATCTTDITEQPFATQTTTRHASFVGGPGLVIGGVLVGALGTAVFASSSEQPEFCDDGDDQCVSKDQTRAIGAVGWGLGAAGIAVGLYRTFKQPTIIDKRPVPVGAATVTHENAPCNVATRNVPVSFGFASGSPVLGTTNGDGEVSFQLDGDTLPVGTTAVLGVGAQHFRIDLSAIARAAPPAPDYPEQDAACQLEPTAGNVVLATACMLGLNWLVEKGIDAAADDVATSLARALNVNPDGQLKNIVAYVLANYGGKLTKESAIAMEREICCRSIRYVGSEH